MGAIINSCIFRFPSLCFPPLITLQKGIGITNLFPVNFPNLLYNEFLAEAFTTARETAKIAFAPNLDLSFVPSKSSINLSISFCFLQSIPISFLEIILFTLSTALRTPLPRYFLLLSLSSNASYIPFEAPLGTDAIPTETLVWTSASTVGSPLESRTCLAFILVILICTPSFTFSKNKIFIYFMVVIIKVTEPHHIVCINKIIKNFQEIKQSLHNHKQQYSLFFLQAYIPP